MEVLRAHPTLSQPEAAKRLYLSVHSIKKRASEIADRLVKIDPERATDYIGTGQWRAIARFAGRPNPGQAAAPLTAEAGADGPDKGLPDDWSHDAISKIEGHASSEASAAMSEEARRAIASASGAFHLDAEDRSVQLVEDWLQANVSRCLMIRGLSGSGKTWLAARLSVRLCERWPTYFGDRPPHAGEPPLYLDRLARQHGPVLVVIDDAIENDRHLDILNAIASHAPLVVVATTRVAKHHGSLRDLQRYLGERLLIEEVGPLLTPQERERLVAERRDGSPSHAEREMLATASIRRAVARLSAPTVSALHVAELVGYLHDEAVARVMLPTLFASRLGLRLPARPVQVIANPTSLALPAELEPWLMSRAAADGAREVWIEPDLADYALDAVAAGLAPAEVRKLEVNLLSTVVEELDPTEPSERRFMRNLLLSLRHYDAQVANQLTAAAIGQIEDLVRHEERPALAYVWVRALQLASHSDGVLNAMRDATRGLGAPTTAADVILLAELFGDDRAARLLKERLPDATQWDLKPWAEAVELAVGLRRGGSGRRSVLSSLCRTIRATNIDSAALLGSRNVAQDLVAAVADDGSATDREWLAKATFGWIRHGHVRTPYHVCVPAIELLGRSLMQGRARELLRLPADVLTARAAPANGRSVAAGLHDRYEVLRRREARLLEESAALATIGDVVQNALRNPNLANALLPKAMKFVGSWGPKLAHAEVVQAAWDAVLPTLQDGARSNHVVATIQVLLRQDADSASHAESLQRLARQADLLDPRLVVELLLRLALRRAVRDPIGTDPAFVTALDSWLRRGAATHPDVFARAATSLDFPTSLPWDDTVRAVAKQPGVLSYLGVAIVPGASRLLASRGTHEPLVVAADAWRCWAPVPRMAQPLLSTGFAFSDLGLCLRALELLDRSADSAADDLCHEAAVDAAFRDEWEAVRKLARAAELRSKGKGARPSAAHRAYSALARRSEDEAGTVWSLARELALERPLRSAKDVLTS
ncbi:MAG: hypothetical protein ACT4PW_04430 [Acidimicrobiia bacterium]